jgi:hypothetical protein
MSQITIQGLKMKEKKGKREKSAIIFRLID